jgi:ABC-type uncharacterized transport system fused permease/ATPase subunit
MRSVLKSLSSFYAVLLISLILNAASVVTVFDIIHGSSPTVNSFWKSLSRADVHGLLLFLGLIIGVILAILLVIIAGALLQRRPPRHRRARSDLSRHGGVRDASR